MAVDWVTASSLATGAGTLVLAIATFASVRSANRNARIAERTLAIGMQPLLMPSRQSDPPQPVGFADQHKVHLAGGGATAEVVGHTVYLTMSVRNAGQGLAVIRGWSFVPTTNLMDRHADVGDFRRHQRDMYVAPQDVGFWQAAVRDADDPLGDALRPLIERRDRIIVDILYGDLDERLNVARFSIQPGADGETWWSAVSRHWRL